MKERRGKSAKLIEVSYFRICVVSTEEITFSPKKVPSFSKQLLNGIVTWWRRSNLTRDLERYNFIYIHTIYIYIYRIFSP